MIDSMIKASAIVIGLQIIAAGFGTFAAVALTRWLSDRRRARRESRRHHPASRVPSMMRPVTCPTDWYPIDDAGDVPPLDLDMFRAQLAQVHEDSKGNRLELGPTHLFAAWQAQEDDL